MSQNDTTQSTRPQQSESLLPKPIATPSAFKPPAPLPYLPNPSNYPSCRKLPGAPIVRIIQNGHDDVVLQWIVPRSSRISVAAIKCYQLFAYIQIPEKEPSSDDWKFIGTIKALPLPMFCRLIKFDRLHVNYCAIRAGDVYYRFGRFSLPIMIHSN